jgi:putative membrane protein
VHEPGVQDATRRTRLANERTYLAWWRSGLTALAVSFGAGRIVPELTGGATWPYALLGAGFGVLGLAFILFAFTRQRRVEEALRTGGYAAFGERAALAFTVAGLLLGVGTILIVVLQG